MELGEERFGTVDGTRKEGRGKGYKGGEGDEVAARLEMTTMPLNEITDEFEGEETDTDGHQDVEGGAVGLET